MGYTQPWHSSHGVDPSVFDRDFGRIVCFLRDGDRVFLTYGSTGRGVEAIMSSLKLLDITVYGAPRGVGGLAGGLAPAAHV